jgi:hypothetical protein
MLDPKRSLWPSSVFSKKLLHSKGSWSLKWLQAVRRAQRKAESILSTEINLTTSSDKGKEYMFTSSKPFSSRKTKLAKSSHRNTELVVSLIVNNEEHLLRVQADTDASSIILETYTSAPFIKTDDSNTTIWRTMGGKFTTNKTGFVAFSLPEFNLKKRISWAFHIDDRSKSSSTYDMIFGNV